MRPNRFLTGSLVWFPDLQFCAFIGNCCADADVLAEAEREWKYREKKRLDEDYLLAALPLVAQKRAILQTLRPVALEAVRAYRKFRNTLPQVHDQLRQMKHRYGGQLTLTEVIRDESDEEESDYHGPAGFKGRGKDAVETRDHTFGSFTGFTAVVRDYNPLKDLETIQRKLASVAPNGYGDEALYFIAAMSDQERNVSVIILQEVEELVATFRHKLKDLGSFYTRENAESLNRFYAHDLNPLYYRVELTSVRSQPTLRFKKGTSNYDLVRESWATKLDFDWPTS